ncbi:MAG: tail fiber domain-containing protein [Dokdonella sp.]
MNEHEQLRAHSPGSAPPKRRYQSPSLKVFGKVALLTQSVSGCNQGDNPNCGAGNNMGPTMVSARMTKENIMRIGTHPLGIGLYLFDYRPEYRERWGHGKQFGVMADEVEAVLPEAVVIHPDGYQMVNYAVLARASRAIH